MINWVNYFLTSKQSRLINGHIKAEDLYQKILDHDGSTAYCCYFDLDEKLLKLEWDTGEKDKDGKTIYEYHLSGQTPKNPDYKCNGKSFAKYEGICRPALNMVSFDFDAEDPQESLDDVRKFLAWLDIDDAVVFFSGSKGFHIMIPFGYFDLEPNEHLPNQLKDLAKHLKEFYPTLDDSIYNYNRKFRVPFSQHEKGSYKQTVNVEWNMQYILQASNEPFKEDFLEDIAGSDQKPLQVITDAIEQSKRKSYEVEKERAGTIEAPSGFEKWDNKLCIKKMLEQRCDDVGRNNACIRIVNDYYRTGKPQSICEEAVMKWAANNGLSVTEVSTIITNIYQRGANYNFGCQDEVKAAFCSKKCIIYPRLEPDKRPIPFDLTEADKVKLENSTKMKNEFIGVQWMMENLFSCYWDKDTGRFSDGFIVKQSAKHLFYYKDKHWQEVDEAKIHILKTKLNEQYENKLTLKKLDSVFKMFILYVPEVPEGVDLFAPKKDMSNFLDGTLHLERIDGKFKLNFKGHNKLDFCSTMIDLKYSSFRDNESAVNKEFEDWLMGCLDNDEEAYKLIQEMFGASLMPRFPQFFVLVGKSGTGKSTTIKILKQLHKDDKNISGVSPDKFHGFHMGSMVGKLMNIVGDIKTNCKIDDDIVKQVDDQEPIRIEIKKVDDVYTTLPALQIFGGNKMPKTEEGYSGAMSRRFSIINFDKVYDGKRNTEISKDLFNASPEGILAFSMRGLERLVCQNNGEYSKSKRSAQNVDDWAKRGDYLWQFLEDAQEEGVDAENGTPVKLILEKDESILRSTLWVMFNNWQQVAIEPRNQLGKMAFMSMIKDSSFDLKRRKNGWMVHGIGTENFENDEV